MPMRNDSVVPTCSNLAHGSNEDIAAAAYGLDQGIPARYLGELAANPPQLHVDGAIEGGGFPPARPVQQLLAREDALRALDQTEQQVMLAPGQVQRGTVRRDRPNPDSRHRRPAGRSD